MSRLSCVAPVTAAGWPDLADELDRWQEAEQVATLWWRDDDAVAPGVRLSRLASIAGTVPIALAVIPATAEPELAAWLSDHARCAPGTRLGILQHGWRHANHSVAGKKSEFPPSRSYEEVAVDLAAGRTRLLELFEDRALPVLVPPWNRFDDVFLPALADCGIRAISRGKQRHAGRPADRVIEVDVHVDLVAWSSGRGFIGDEAALGSVVGHLRARRLGGVCADKPTGILTHHLVQDGPTDTFLRRLIAVSCGHAAARWLDAIEIFAPAIPAPA